VGKLPALSHDDLSREKQTIWDRVMSGRTGAAGPYGIPVPKDTVTF
jgi:hypothetical protein